MQTIQTSLDLLDHLVQVQDLITEANLAIANNYLLPNVSHRSPVAETCDIGAEVGLLVKLWRTWGWNACLHIL